MTYNFTAAARKAHDHFEPEAALDPQEQKALRGHLEQIDIAAYAANREVLGQALRHADLAKFSRLAVFAAQARAKWTNAALIMMEKGEAMTAEDVAHLATLRSAFEELTEAYEALRRMVERGYLTYRSK
jgi:hypothetical protein